MYCNPWAYVNENEEVSLLVYVILRPLKDVESQSTDKKVANSCLERDISELLIKVNDAYATTFEHAQEKADMSIDIDKARIST